MRYCLNFTQINFTRIQSLPNKHDSFDTIGIETIVLFLFAKTPEPQGFSVLLLFGVIELVSLWLSGAVFTTAANHAETIPASIPVSLQSGK